MSELVNQNCRAYESDTPPLDADAAKALMQKISANWRLGADGASITGEFEFKNYYRTTAFVNAVAWIAHGQDHHPDITFGYKNCSIFFTTHDIGGLSENDFISAAKIDQLVD